MSHKNTVKRILNERESTQSQINKKLIKIDMTSGEKPFSNPHMKRYFKCFHCDQRFPKFTDMAQHVKDIHKPMAKPLMRCVVPECNFKTYNKDLLKKHQMSSKHIYSKKTSEIDTDEPFVPPLLSCIYTGCQFMTNSRDEMSKHRLMSKHFYRKTHSKLREVLQNGNYSSVVDKNGGFSGIIHKFRRNV